MKLSLIAMIALASCNQSTPTPAQQAAVASEAIEDKACVTDAQKDTGKAALQADIDACRVRVVAKWHDGGTR